MRKMLGVSETKAKGMASKNERINYLKGQLAIGWANVAIGEKSVSNETDRIANELMIGMRDLDRKDRELIKDWIYEGIHAGKEISGEILNWLMRGAPKTIAEVTGRIEEMSDSKGNEKGSKRVEQTYRDWETDRKSTRLNSSHRSLSRMPSSA